MNTKAGTHRQCGPPSSHCARDNLCFALSSYHIVYASAKMGRKQASGLWQDKNYVNNWKRDWLNRHPEKRATHNIRMRRQRNDFIESLERSMGGECQRCGYDSCLAVLDFHHVNSQEKDGLVSNLATRRKWAEAEDEADKCVLLCGNCHREYEHGFWIGQFVKRDGLGYTIESWEYTTDTEQDTPFMNTRNNRPTRDRDTVQLTLF